MKKNKSGNRPSKGYFCVRAKGKNAYEARVTLEYSFETNKDCRSTTRLSKGGRTEREAKLKLAEKVLEYIEEHSLVLSENCENNLRRNLEYLELITNNAILPSKSNMSFETIAIKWLDYKAKKKLSDKGRPILANTFKGYVNIVKNYLIPHFKGYCIAEISAECIDNYISEVYSKKPRLAEDLKMLLMSILKYSYNDLKVISKIPAPEIKPKRKFRQTKEKIEYLDSDDYSYFVELFIRDGRQYSLLFAVMLLTGLRPEEACGLKFSQVDFDKKNIHIDNAYKDEPILDKNHNVIGHKRCDGELKTEESYRNIPLTDTVKEIITKIRYDRHSINPNEYVFLNEKNEPYTSKVLGRKLMQLRKQYGILKRITPYSLRHSYATTMVENGVSIEVLHQLMGHNDVRTTLKYYTHISEKQKFKSVEEAFSKLDSNNTKVMSESRIVEFRHSCSY